MQGEQYSYKEALILRDYKVEDVYSMKSGNRDKVICFCRTSLLHIDIALHRLSAMCFW